MTQNSQADPGTSRRHEIAGIAEDLRRQREDLARMRRSSSASSAETAQIVAKIETLRRRMESLKTDRDESRA